jgi:hypothetical protein
LELVSGIELIVVRNGRSHIIGFLGRIMRVVLGLLDVRTRGRITS